MEASAAFPTVQIVRRAKAYPFWSSAEQRGEESVPRSRNREREGEEGKKEEAVILGVQEHVASSRHARRKCAGGRCYAHQPTHLVTV